jgi:hypothetical protein
MCHRHLSFKKSSDCGHLIFIEERSVDCQDSRCFNSSTHPPDCAARSADGRCRCRRYFTYVLFPGSFTFTFPHPPQHVSQPERVVLSDQVFIYLHSNLPCVQALQLVANKMPRMFHPVSIALSTSLPSSYPLYVVAHT